MAGGGPLSGAAEEEAEGKEPLARRRRPEVERDVERFPRRHAQRRQAAATHDGAVVGQLPFTAEIGEVGEVAAVTEPKAVGPELLDRHGAGEELQLEEPGVRRAVGPDEAVRAEVRVVRRVAEVAAVGPVAPASVVGAADAVVDPLPDEAALERTVPLEGGEVIGESTVRVPHRVRVLAKDQRPAVAAGLCPGLDLLDRGVHRTHDVGGALPARPVPRDRTLVVQRTRRVAPARPAGRSVVVFAVAALVAQRPEQ